jgi:hypothetical protein
MVGYANPTKELLIEAQRVFEEEAQVTAIISIGAGKDFVSNSPERHDENSIVATMMQVIYFVLFLMLLGYGGKDNASGTAPTTNTLNQVSRSGEPTHVELERRLHNTFIYYRLNIDQSLLGLKDDARIISLTQEYLKKADIDSRLNELIKVIQARPKGKTLKELSKSLTIHPTLF